MKCLPGRVRRTVAAEIPKNYESRLGGGCQRYCALRGPVSTVLHWGRTGVLRRIKLGRHVRFLRADVERLVRERNDEAMSRG